MPKKMHQSVAITRCFYVAKLHRKKPANISYIIPLSWLFIHNTLPPVHREMFLVLAIHIDKVIGISWINWPSQPPTSPSLIHATLTSKAWNQVIPVKASYCYSTYHTDTLHAPLTLKLLKIWMWKMKLFFVKSVYALLNNLGYLPLFLYRGVWQLTIGTF